MTEIIGRLARHPNRPERFALLHLDGSVSNYFAIDDTREFCAGVLAKHGLTLHDDDTVTRADAA